MVQLRDFDTAWLGVARTEIRTRIPLGGFCDLERRQVLPGERRKNGFHFILDYPALKDNAQHPASEPWTSGFRTIIARFSPF